MIIQGQSEKTVATAPSEVVLLSVKAFNAGDLEAALACFAEHADYESIGVPPGQPDAVKGQEQLRAWFEGLATQHSRVEVKVLKVEEDVVRTETRTWSDSTRQLGVAPLVATEQYLVQDGKIQSAIRTIHPESVAKLQAALVHIEE